MRVFSQSKLCLVDFANTYFVVEDATIMAHTHDGEKHIMGIYSGEDRAKEVLEELCNESQRELFYLVYYMPGK